MSWFFDANGQPTDEAIALVAYLQKLGTNIPWREDGVAQYLSLHPDVVPEEIVPETPAEGAGGQ
jgi:hypothetical protein